MALQKKLKDLFADLKKKLQNDYIKIKAFSPNNISKKLEQIHQE